MAGQDAARSRSETLHEALDAVRKYRVIATLQVTPFPGQVRAVSFGIGSENERGRFKEVVKSDR